jgi:hypothetical protein
MDPPSEDQLSFTRLRRKWNGFKIQPPTPREFAEQLTYYESRLFCAIRSRELLGWLKCHTSKDVQNLSKFVSTCDRLAGWVKESILKEAGVVQRAEEIQRWIIVAEVSFVSPSDWCQVTQCFFTGRIAVSYGTSVRCSLSLQRCAAPRSTSLRILGSM